MTFSDTNHKIWPRKRKGQFGCGLHITRHLHVKIGKRRRERMKERGEVFRRDLFTGNTNVMEMQVRKNINESRSQIDSIQVYTLYLRDEFGRGNDGRCWVSCHSEMIGIQTDVCKIGLLLYK